MYQTLTASALLFFLLAGSARAQDKLSLNLRFAKGEARHITSSTTQTIDQTLRDAQQQTRQTITVTYSLAIDDVDSRGAATLAVKYEAVTFDSTGPAGHVAFDSSAPPGQVPETISGMAAMVGKGYTAHIDPDGKVTQISGAKELLDKVLGQLAIEDPTARAAADKSLRQQISEAGLKQGLQNLFAPLPDHPVAVGDSWNRSGRATHGITIDTETTYTLQSHEPGTASLAIAAKADTPKSALLPVGPLTVTYDLHGNQSGSLHLDTSTGWPQSASLTQHLTGSLTLRGPNTDPQAVPVTIDSTTKITVKQ